MQRTIVVLAICLVTILPVLANGTDQSRPLDELEMSSIVGQGGCGVAKGFATGAGFSAAILGVIPGGQGAAVILGISAGLVAVTVTIVC